MSTGSRFVLPYQTVIDTTGVPLPGAFLYFYASGTSSPLNTYSDEGLTTPNSNPVVANAAGVFPNIFLSGAQYKVILTDSLANQIWTADPVAGIGVESESQYYAFNTTTELLAAFSSGVILADGTQASTSGRTVEGDLGGAVFFYNESDTTTADNGGTIRVDGQNRRWYALNANFTPALFGTTTAAADAGMAAAMAAAVPENATLTFSNSADYTFASNIAAPADLVLDGNFASVNKSLNVDANNIVKNLSSTATDPIISTNSSLTNMIFDELTLAASGDGYAVQLTAATMTDMDFLKSNLSAGGYDILLSTGTATRIRAIGNTLASVDADNIELDFSGGGSKFAIVSSNFMKNTGTGGAGSAGFAVGLAGMEAVAVFGNVIQDSQFDCFHFEDLQKNNTVVANIAYGRSHGFVAYPYTGNLEAAVPFVGNVLNSLSAGSNNGVYLFFTTPGTISGMPIIGNCIVGYAAGIYCGASSSPQPAVITLADGNSISASTTAIAAAGQSNAGECRQFGTNYATGETSLFNATAAHFAFGKVVSDTIPTNIILSPGGGYGGLMPSCCDGFAFPVARFTTSNGSNNIPLFALPSSSSTMHGVVKARFRRSGVADWAYITGTVVYTGGAWTIDSTPSLAYAGNVTAIALSGSGVNLYAVVTTTGAIALDFNFVEFDGDMWDA